MAFEVKLPDIGEGIAEGEIVEYASNCSVPIVHKSEVGQGWPVASRVVTTGPSVEMIVMFAGTRIASRYVPGLT